MGRLIKIDQRLEYSILANTSNQGFSCEEHTSKHLSLFGHFFVNLQKNQRRFFRSMRKVPVPSIYAALYSSDPDPDPQIP
jgi:hypothetical protein